jgi:hypothetical protein
MLTKLVVRFDPDQYRVRESASGLAAPFEDEDDDEHEDEIENPTEKNNILTHCTTEDTKLWAAAGWLFFRVARSTRIDSDMGASLAP